MSLDCKLNPNVATNSGVEIILFPPVPNDTAYSSKQSLNRYSLQCSITTISTPIQLESY